jgi:SAM-dependent methyltransferase
LSDGYRDDLAYIHHEGFGQIAHAAAGVLVEDLRRRDVKEGLVVDLGCGSGIVSELVSAAGFDVLGVDLSPAFIAMARSRVPKGRFKVGSILTADIPPCVAVAAIGEVCNYLFDDTHSWDAVSRLFERIFAALAPGGPQLLDVAGPGRVVGPSPQK